VLREIGCNDGRRSEQKARRHDGCMHQRSGKKRVRNGPDVCADVFTDVAAPAKIKHWQPVATFSDEYQRNDAIIIRMGNRRYCAICSGHEHKRPFK
jgi:hypothetical protein